MKNSISVIQERHEKIIELVHERERISVDELSEILKVSLATVRRDLDVLNSKHIIDRYYGGAKSFSLDDAYFSYSSKSALFIEEKRIIGKCMSLFIPENSVIFCNGGSTVVELFKIIKHRDITIITSNARIFQEASGGKCRLICLGGEYNYNTETFVNDLTPNIIAKYKITHCIFGVNAFSRTFGETTPTANKLNLSNFRSQASNIKVFILAVGNKIGKAYCFGGMDIMDVDYLITDSSADKNELQHISDEGVKVVVADKYIEK